MLIPHNGHTLLGTGHCCIKNISVKQHARAGQQRHNDSRILTALRFVDCNGISQFQFVKLCKAIGHPASFIKFYHQLFRKMIDLPDNAHIAVKNAHALVQRQIIMSQHFPFDLIIIPDLHDLVPFTDNTLMKFALFLVRGRRVQIVLQYGIQPLYPQFSFAHRRQHLDIVRPCIDKLRKLVSDQKHHDPQNLLDIISFQAEKVLAFVAKFNLPSLIDQMGILDDIAFQCLSENLRQTYHLKTFRINDILQHIARSDTRQLVHIPYKDQPCAHGYGLQKGIHQIDIHHRHLINNDHIRFQGIVLIALKLCSQAVVIRSA